MNAKAPRITNGNLLIAEPFMGDNNFDRSVVLVCEHSDAGTFGLVLNQPTDIHLGDVIDEVQADLPLFIGGPVQQNTLHFIHRRPDLIDDSIRIAEGLYWSGNFEQIKRAVNLGTLTERDARFFIGYSGWSEGQLADELLKKSWIISQADASFLFDTPVDQFWRGVLKRMGGEYKSIAHYPVDPRLN
ncbi:YqgE/AlgH family protein [Spirosoma sp. KUDC1026]|uniref:YqgE/AlgH family protein n=1 Tax=Spirosoma sp. KUDC1026 TaxID=2745947 RepID=UPI00159BD50B|nr:YqgE/AlgH family protein [Spirosoma sp. KUDC1026]QKZ15374.1 YqgE/AlgH family protein [Spirosoma sp. KUDC1026]